MPVAQCLVLHCKSSPPGCPLPPPPSPPRPCPGKYALPWDMTTSQHRQFNPLFILQRSAAFLSEATDTLRRRWGQGRGRGEGRAGGRNEGGWDLQAAGVGVACEVCRWHARHREQACTGGQCGPCLDLPQLPLLSACPPCPPPRRDAGQNDPIWLRSALLPDYYQDGFHYQTDGWLSSKSGEGRGRAGRPRAGPGLPLWAQQGSVPHRMRGRRMRHEAPRPSATPRWKHQPANHRILSWPPPHPPLPTSCSQGVRGVHGDAVCGAPGRDAALHAGPPARFHGRQGRLPAAGRSGRRKGVWGAVTRFRQRVGRRLRSTC